MHFVDVCQYSHLSKNLVNDKLQLKGLFELDRGSQTLDVLQLASKMLFQDLIIFLNQLQIDFRKQNVSYLKISTSRGTAFFLLTWKWILNHIFLKEFFGTY